MPDDADNLRLTEILTTSAAVADYVGADTVLPAHVIEAIAVLRGERTMDELGRGRSPLVPRWPGSGAVQPDLRELSRRWFEALGSEVAATLSESQLAAFQRDVQALITPGS